MYLLNVGPSDICMMYSVTDVQGLNCISERVLSNAAHDIVMFIAFLWTLVSGYFGFMLGWFNVCILFPSKSE